MSGAVVTATTVRSVPGDAAVDWPLSCDPNPLTSDDNV